MRWRRKRTLCVCVVLPTAVMSDSDQWLCLCWYNIQSMAPEMLLPPAATDPEDPGGYSYAVDWWALGVLLFEMVTPCDVVSCRVV